MLYKRDQKTIKHLRFRASLLFRNGHSQTFISKELRISRQTVNHWHFLWITGGKKGISTTWRVGRKSKLNSIQTKKLIQILDEGAKIHGFSNNLWTQSRVKFVIKRNWSIEYHLHHISRLMKSLNWNYQRLPNRAVKDGNNKVMRWAKYRYWSRAKNLSKSGSYQKPIHAEEPVKRGFLSRRAIDLIKKRFDI